MSQECLRRRRSASNGPNDRVLPTSEHETCVRQAQGRQRGEDGPLRAFDLSDGQIAVKRETVGLHQTSTRHLYHILLAEDAQEESQLKRNEQRSLPVSQF